MKDGKVIPKPLNREEERAMPVIPILKGTVTVIGMSRGTEQTIYSKSLNAYGETIGELLDSIVKAAAVIAGDVFEWCFMNKPEGYKLSDDAWQIRTQHPDVSDIVTANPVPAETSNGGSIETIENIVRTAVVIRSITGFINLAKLKQLGAVDTDASMEEAKDANAMRNDISFEEMTTYGFTGAQLDAIVRDSMLQGRIPATVFNQRTAENPQS